MIQVAVTAGLLLQHTLETRLDAAIATTTSTFFDALDDDDRATAKLHVQRAAQVAEEAWQQTIGRASWAQRHKPDNVRPASPDEDSDDMDFSAPPTQCTAALRRLMNTLPKGPGSRVRGSKTCATRTSPTSGSITWTRVRKVFLRPTILSPTCRKDLETWRGQDLASADCVALSWTHNANTEEPAAPPKPHKTQRMRSRRVMWIEPRRNPEGSQQHNPGRLIFSLYRFCPRWMCVCGLTGSRRRSEGGV